MFRLKPQHVPLVATTVVFALLYVSAALRYDGFFQWYMFASMLSSNASLAVAALGMTFVILSGGIDLSVGAVVAFSSILLAKMLVVWQLPVAVAIPLALTLGLAFGAVMGVLIHAFRLPPFLVTLAGMFLARGGALALTPQKRLNITDNTTFQWLVDWRTLDYLSLPAVVMLGGTALAIVVAGYTRFGRTVYALGGSESSATLMGLPVARTRISIYALSGLCAALGGVIHAIKAQAGDSTVATGMELDAIAAVVIGGTLLSGGVGYPVGTLLGVMILGVITAVLNLQGTLSSWWTRIAIGGLLLAFIVLQQLLQLTRDKRR
ncbi:MAG: sugar ABC transporter permease YjfF [Planctomycetes bacterium]|nr:sugar ABC transporter permease YjfF [Planctomycetota bacterium]